MPFTLGQRWISDTESELGLGTVVAIDARMVTLLFPACGENRLYSRHDAPITRVMFNVGILSPVMKAGSSPSTTLWKIMAYLFITAYV